MKSKIVLLNPVSDYGGCIRSGRCQTRFQPGLGLWPPVDLAEIGACIKTIKGEYDIWLFDAQVSNDYVSMISSLKMYEPTILIINCTTPTLQSDLQIAHVMKQWSKEIKILFFGLHGTAYPEDVLKDGSVDWCILGEAEYSIYKICECIINNNSQIYSIPNIAYLDENQNIKFTNRGNDEETKKLFLKLWPDRSLYDNGLYKLKYNNKIFTIVRVARGCEHNCIYCTARMYSGRLCKRSVESVLTELKEIKYKYGIEHVMFLSDNFTEDLIWIDELCNRILNEKLQIQWIANSRVDTIDEQRIILMKKAGCWLLSLGIESGNDMILKNAAKGINTNKSRETVNILHKYGFVILGYFMIGLPGETKETVEETIDFACSLPLNFAYFYYATPFPGTILYQICEKNGWLITKEWKKYFHGENALICYNEEFYKYISSAKRKAYRRFYFRISWFLKQIKSIKSIRILINYMEEGIRMIKQ